MPDDRQRLIVALVQKKVAEVLQDERFGASFQMGMLASFESFSHILQRDWAALGPKLESKIHIYVGDMDNYYLNNAVYLIEDFLEGTTDPPCEGVVDYGDRAEHCWNGDHTRSNALSRLRYNQMFIPIAVERMEKTAPEGADLTSWRY